MAAFAPPTRPPPARAAATRTGPARSAWNQPGSQLRWQYRAHSGAPKLQRDSVVGDVDEVEHRVAEEDVPVQAGVAGATALNGPLCTPGPLLRCECLNHDEARQFAIDKLSQTAAYTGRWAAAMQAGQLGFAMPRNLRAELTAGAKTVVDRLKSRSINIACDPKTSSGNVGQYVHPDNIFLTPIAVRPSWSQALLNKVVLHEALHAVCAHLPSQPGKDPYDQAGRLGLDNNEVMHRDLTAIMRAFPDNTPLW